MRCIRLWTDASGISRFEDGKLVLKTGSPVNLLSEKLPTKSISFAETQAGQSLDWHNAPAKQFVITLRGTLHFWNKLNESVVITPGDILLAEDTMGQGHAWKLIGDEPWRRAYVILETDGDVLFVKN